MKTLKTAVVALLGMMAASAAHAQNCYVGGLMGGSIASMGLEAPAFGGLGVDGLGARSSRPDFGGTVGCDVAVGNSPLFVGLAAKFVTQDVAFNVNPGLLSVSLGNSWGAAMRGGYRFDSGAKAFAKVGWTQTDLKLGGLIAPALTGLDIPGRLQGVTFGGGMETPLKGTQLVMGVEVDWIRYNKESIAGGLVDLRADQLQGMVTLKYMFGAPPAVVSTLK